MKRETISSLLARQLGFRVASGVLYHEGLDLALHCDHCGKTVPIDVEKDRLTWKCPACGATGQYPEHLLRAARQNLAQRCSYDMDVNQRIESARRRDQKQHERNRDHGFLILWIATAIIAAMMVLLFLMRY